MNKCGRRRCRGGQKVVDLFEAQSTHDERLHASLISFKRGFQCIRTTKFGGDRLAKLLPHPRWAKKDVGFALRKISCERLEGFIKKDLTARIHGGKFHHLTLRNMRER